MLYQKQGVTFVELVIVISIFSIIAGTLLLNFSRFGRSITLQNLAQDIALQINSAQKEAISGRTNDLSALCDRTTQVCAPTYGVYIAAEPDADNLIMGTYNDGEVGRTLLTFFDYKDPRNAMLNDGDNLCGTGTNTECLDNISLGQGNYISAICVGLGNVCTDDISSSSGLHIAFKRPFQDAIMHQDDGETTGVKYNYARITVKSPNVDTPTKDIIITGLGQISIGPTP